MLPADDSDFTIFRRKFKPVIPPALAATNFEFAPSDRTESMAFHDEVRGLFPQTYGMPKLEIIPREGLPDHPRLTVGVIFSGGQAPGGHNVISGLFDKLRQFNKDSVLIGFRGGPDGLLSNDGFEITEEIIDLYRNMGGFDLLGSGRTKIEGEDRFLAVEKTVRERNLSALVIIGGDDSNTNACLIAERFLQRHIDCCVLGVPKTIDRDLTSPAGIETSFGFDSATKVYSVLIANICRDCLSAKKYWHFIRLMGRSASHITLECGLQTHPNLMLIGEEVAEKKETLERIVSNCTDVIEKRMRDGKNFGICLVPEGLIEFIPSIGTLISTLSDVLAKDADCANPTPESVRSKLPKEMAELFDYLPAVIQRQLLLDRDSHGNVQVSLIETEKLLIELIRTELGRRDPALVKKFCPQTHFLGYEGRCVAPSNFDATYCYCLGMSAAVLATARRSGYMACLTGITAPHDQWKPCGLPITSLLTIERRHGTNVPVIQKQLVALDGRPFREFVSHRDEWAAGEHYRNPGPIQYYSGDADRELRAVADRATMCLDLEHGRA